MTRASIVAAFSLGLLACGNSPPDQPDSATCTSCFDVAHVDATIDRVMSDWHYDYDVATPDSHDVPGDRSDAGMFFDANFDTSVVDVPNDAPRDVRVDAPRDVGVDTGSTTGGCISGATGNYVARFGWQGSQGSTANPRYEVNTLPDATRWHVSAASRSGIGYTPTYDDTFLGPGGLDLETPAFMDVELSTAGLSVIRGVTIAIYGRSFDTTASGSFSWQTFSGTGDAPFNLIANSTPYRWYGADATLSFVPGDNGVLLRIEPGPSSDALIVNRVEICFDAL